MTLFRNGAIACAALVTSGCSLLLAPLAKSQTDQAIADGQAERQRQIAEIEANAAPRRTEMFAVQDAVWLCPTPEQARANDRCAGGKRLVRNQDLAVFGEAPEEGVWRSEYWDGDGKHDVFVLASAVSDRPDISGLEAARADLDARYPPAKRIAASETSYVDFVTRPARYRGRYLLLMQESADMANKEFEGGVFRFTIPIKGMPTSKYPSALAVFELHSAAMVDQFQNGERAYRCGPQFCDMFLIAARFTGKTVDSVDETGAVRRLPLFRVEELADRYGHLEGRR